MPSKPEKRKYYRREDIQRSLEDSFGDLAHPGERASVEEASDASFAVIESLGMSWRRCEQAAVFYHDDQSVAALSQEGFRYYLPAFLLTSFDNLKEIADYAFFEQLISRLEEDYQGDISGYWDRGRRAVTATVLEAVAQDTPDPGMRGRIQQLANGF